MENGFELDKTKWEEVDIGFCPEKSSLEFITEIATQPTRMMKRSTTTVIQSLEIALK